MLFIWMHWGSSFFYHLSKKRKTRTSADIGRPLGAQTASQVTKDNSSARATAQDDCPKLVNYLVLTRKSTPDSESGA